MDISFFANVFSAIPGTFPARICSSFHSVFVVFLFFALPDFAGRPGDSRMAKRTSLTPYSEGLGGSPKLSGRPGFSGPDVFLFFLEVPFFGAPPFAVLLAFQIFLRCSSPSPTAVCFVSIILCLVGSQGPSRKLFQWPSPAFCAPSPSPASRCPFHFRSTPWCPPAQKSVFFFDRRAPFSFFFWFFFS